MTTPSPQPGSIPEQIAELQDLLNDSNAQSAATTPESPTTPAREKIILSEQVHTFVREHLAAIQEKLAARAHIYPADLAFIGELKLWMAMPQEWREKFKSIQEMKTAEEMKENTLNELQEAGRRKITPQQWRDLLHVAGFKCPRGKEKEWIDQTFKFPGSGKIVVEESLDLNGCMGLSSLPANLSVGGNLYLNDCTEFSSLPANLSVGGNLYLSDCTELSSLPANLSVGRHLYLSGCTGLSSLPVDLSVGGSLDLSGCTGLFFLPSNLSVGGFLDLGGCTGLTSLPANLSVGWHLYLSGCTGLSSLPVDLSVGGSLYISVDLAQEVINKAKKLKAEGKIKGNIIQPD